MSRLQYENTGGDTARPAPASDDEDVELNEQSDEDEISETEQELERLVFGDSTGFRDGLKDFSLEEDGEVDGDAATGPAALAALQDTDLFFTDLAGDVTHDSLQVAPAETDVDATYLSRLPPAWEDSDDERILVSLASQSRLRKLRRSEVEDVISGKEYSRRLRQQFEVLSPRPEWAVQAMGLPAKKRRRISNGANDGGQSSEEEMDSEEQLPSVAPLAKLLQDAENLVRQSGRGSGKKRKLRPEVIDIQRARDVGDKQPSSITSLSFHPRHPLLLSSGPSSTLFLHHISPSPPAPTPNPLLTSMHIRRNPLTNSAFHPVDGRIFLSSPKQHFHVWNLNTGRVEKVSQFSGQSHEQRSMENFKLSPDGNYMALLGTAKKGGGVVNILSAASLQWVAQARVESRNGIADFCWWRNSTGLSIIGKNGEVSEWSVHDQRVIARWQDEGAVGTTTLSLGGQHEFSKSSIGTDRWIAIGSSSGIVNIYDRRVWLASPPVGDAQQPIPVRPKPLKTLDHLTTPTSQLTFSPDGQLLAMSSKWRSDAFKLVHLPSCTVYKNWPTSSTPLGRVTQVAFAAGELVGEDIHSLLAVANEQGKIRMWEIR